MHQTGWTLLPLALLAACTSELPAAGVAGAQQCFWNSQVTGFSDAGADRAIVNIGSRESWELELSPGCPDVDYAQRIGIVSRGGSRICTGANVELVVPDASGSNTRRCLVRGVRQLSPEEAAAVRGRVPPR
ncbi:DUF6491 family protein [Sphingomonas sp. AX6]|uniref:DUF6491 family protein n=1 Tax=Sphingomonas sp. AX6 TaxID=2653171 RepID=UPI0012F10AD3|nr:DUF6491 family protein [Sphingomonas sp. AX6]VXC85305.1 conserved exported hypothetical protein [Sphingomonas sp. AX6]